MNTRNHEQYHICPRCGHEYDLRRESGICPLCGEEFKTKQIINKIKNMITKDVARLIFNCYTEIESGKKMIDELNKAIDENGDFVLVDSWGDRKRFLELHIPTKAGYQINQLPMNLGIEAIINHIKNQEKELKRLKEVCKVQLIQS